jgi:hypothetical protein
MKKLSAFSDQLGYRVALFFCFRTGSTNVDFEWFRQPR